MENIKNNELFGKAMNLYKLAEAAMEDRWNSEASMNYFNDLFDKAKQLMNEIAEESGCSYSEVLSCIRKSF